MISLRTLLVAAIVAAAAHSSNAATRVAVVPFDVPQEFRGTPLSTGIADMITTELVKVGGIEVVERAQLDKILREQELKDRGILDPDTAKEAGRVLGVDYIVGGKITEFGIRENKSLLGGLASVLGGAQIRHSTARVAFDFRVVDAENARVLMAKKAEAEDKSSGVTFAGGDLRHLVVIGDFRSSEWAESRIGKATRKAVDEVVGTLVDYFPATGRVMAVFEQSGRRYAVLDRGAFGGMESGQEFSVYREQVVLNSNNEEVWRERIDVGRVRVEEIQNDRSKAIIITEEPLMAEGDTFTWERENKPAADRLATEAGEKKSG